MSKILKQMIRLYKPNGIDWMNFLLTKKNPFTYHHITPRSEGGEETIENGAILTRRAHDLLHMLEYACPDAFNDIQNVFRKIHLDEENIMDYLDEIDDILYNVFTGQYIMLIDIDFSLYIEYYCRPDSKQKKYRK